MKSEKLEFEDFKINIKILLAGLWTSGNVSLHLRRLF